MSITDEEWLSIACEGTAFDRMAYADWLEDQGREKESQAWRLIAKAGYHPYQYFSENKKGPEEGFYVFYDSQGLSAVYASQSLEIPFEIRRAMLPTQLMRWFRNPPLTSVSHSDLKSAMTTLVAAILQHLNRSPNET